MKNYDLDLLGLRIQLRTPSEISISESLRPFLSGPHSHIDCVIQVESADSLPAFSQGGVWHQMEYYDSCQGVMRVFHCLAPHSAAFAVTNYYEDGNISIQVLPAYLSYFAGNQGIFNRIGLETMLLQRSGLLLHASLIKYEDKAIAFSGASGVGKSTQAELWRTCLGAQVINGDRAALRREGDTWFAYGSPYAGTSGVYKNESAPLAAIVMLRQSQENHLRRLGGAQALQYLYPECSIHHWDSNFTGEAVDLCLQLMEDVPIYLLECRPDEDAVQLTKKGLGL